MKLKTKITHFNNWVAIHGTKLFGTMWCTYAFIFYSGVLPLIFPDQKETLLYWSNAIQLDALPLLAVGQVLAMKAAENRSLRMYEMVKEQLDIMKDIIHNIDPQYVIDKKKRKTVCD